MIKVKKPRRKKLEPGAKSTAKWLIITVRSRAARVCVLMSR